MVDFGNLKSEGGLAKLNEHMSKHSYVTGYSASHDDAQILLKLLGPPSATSLPHACRWYRHISSFSATQQATWPKGKLATGKLAATDAAKKAATGVQEEAEFDLFGGDAASTKEAAKALAAKKKDESKKKKEPVVNKSSLVLEVKPCDVDTNLDEIWKLIQQIDMNGVKWGAAHKKVPVAFGLFKLQTSCVIIDELVDTEEIVDRIQALGMDPKVAADRKKRLESAEEEDDDEEEEVEGMLVQSAEIVSFNKL